RVYNRSLLRRLRLRRRLLAGGFRSRDCGREREREGGNRPCRGGAQPPRASRPRRNRGCSPGPSRGWGRPLPSPRAEASPRPPPPPPRRRAALPQPQPPPPPLPLGRGPRSD
ncbi:Os07g0490300, partial [Oryza sativa Japonica Group]